MSSSAFALRLASEPVVRVTLEEIARAGARRALQQAIEDEVAEYINAHAAQRDEAGHRLVVRNGSKPPRTILSGVGPLEVIQPRVDDRRVDENGVRYRFTSKILPPYLRKTRAIEDLVPWLYLKGISTGEMGDALIHLGFDGSGSRPPASRACWKSGRENMPTGANATCRANATCTSGPTASTSAAG